MKATYNEKTRKFSLIWYDALKAYKGDKSPYGRKQEAWKKDKHPSKREQALKIAELLKYGQQQEELSRLEAEALKRESLVLINGELVPDSCNIHEPINAVKWLMNIQVRDFSKAENSQTIKSIDRIVKRFREWLKNKYPFIALHEIKQNIIEEYLQLINTSSTAENSYKYLRLLWKKVEIDFEDSRLHYRNPFRHYVFKPAMPSNDKLAFTLQHMRGILHYAAMQVSENDCEEYRIKYRQQKFFILYMLMVTGWRIGDILALQWNQIDFTNRVITLKHKKTAKTTGHETLLYMTPNMIKILKAQYEISNMFPFNKGYVFNVRSLFREVSSPIHYHVEIGKIIKAYCQEKGIYKLTPQESGLKMKNYTIHCIRKGVITELQLAERFSSERIKYLVGHSDSSTEGKHYIKFKMYPERSTRPMVEHLEKAIDAEYCLTMVLGEDDTSPLIYLCDNAKLTHADILQMKSNFWSDEAIREIENICSQGIRRITLQFIIDECDCERRNENLSEVSPNMVKFFHMFHTNNITEANKMLDRGEI